MLSGDGVSGELLKERHHKLRLFTDGVIAVAVSLHHVQGIDMVLAAGGNVDHGAAHLLGHGSVLVLRITYKYVILGGEHQKCHEFFHGKGFAGAGNTQHKGVGIQQLGLVNEDQVAGDAVDAEEDTAGVHDLLHTERNKRGEACRGQRPQSLDLPASIGQDSLETVELLKRQLIKLAHPLIGNGADGVRVVLQLLQTARKVGQGDVAEHHPLIVACEILHKLQVFIPLLLQIGWQDRGEILLFVLIPLPGGNGRLGSKHDLVDLLDGLIHGNRDNVNAQNDLPIQGGQLRHQGIHNEAGIVPEIQHTAILLIQRKVVRLDGHGIGADRVHDAVSPAQRVLKVQRRVPSVLLQNAPEHFQPRFGGQRFAPGAKASKLGVEVRTDPVKVFLRVSDAVPGHSDRDVLVLAKGILPTDMVADHPVVVIPKIVQAVLLQHDPAVPLGSAPVDQAIMDGNLRGGVAVQAVHQDPVGFQHILLFVHRSHGIVDVLEYKGLGIAVFPHKKNTIRPDGTDGDGTLHTAGDAEFLLFLPVPYGDCFHSRFASSVKIS